MQFPDHKQHRRQCDVVASALKQWHECCCIAANCHAGPVRLHASASLQLQLARAVLWAASLHCQLR